MSRPARVVLNLSSLHHNLSRVRQLAPGRAIVAAIKADAYGHGLTRVANVLAGADSFGVACLQEAEQLHEVGIDKPILVLEGPYDTDELAGMRRLGLETVIHHEEQLRMLEAAGSGAPLAVWLKIDTGMHRLGFDPAAATAVWRRLRDCPAVGNISLMSHLATASEPGSPKVDRQLDCFEQACADLPGSRSMANSAGVIAWPRSHYDVVRPGLMLYGISPMDGSVAADHDLQPVMTLQSRLISVKTVKKGGSVGYGGTWTCPEDMPLGIVAAGYGDGFPRHARSGTPVLVEGRRCQLVGNPSMDMLAVDLRQCPAARVGSPVELWGVNLPVEEIARHAGTIPYELVCGVQPRMEVVEQ